MKTAIKVTLGTMLAASVAAPAQANHFNGVALYGTATYTEATNNAATMGMTDPALSPSRYIAVDQDHELDWGLGISWRLGESDTRMFFDYDHFKSSETKSASGLFNLGVNIPGGSGGQAILGQHAEQYRLGIAHTLHFGSRVDLTLNGFLEYAKFDRDFSQAIDDAPVVAVNSHEKVKGFGPGFGASLRAAPFAVCPEFGLFAGLNTSLLYTDNEFRQAYSVDPYTVLLPAALDSRTLEADETHSVVVKFDAEFGIDYRRIINSDMARFLFKAELGMRYMNAINAFKSGNTSYDLSPVSSAPVAVWTGPAHDFGRVGPFLRVTLGGAGA